MPPLVMRAPAGSLLDQTCQLVVRRQIAYGAERGVPWGVSESGYNARDLEMTYQYSNFGVPGLGLRRGLSDDVVVAPYATALAAMIDPGAAVRNFRRLAEAGGSGAYGFYEALDYTPSRLPEDAVVAIVRAYMAHHQGMSLVALDNVLHDGIMRARFHAEPLVQATDLLLQERTPRDVAVARPPAEEVMAIGDAREFVPPVVRRFTTPHGTLPRTHILSNGRYAVMVTAAGGGYSRWRGIAVTRWREDVTRDAGGTYVYLRDAHSGDVWSAGYQPTGREPDSYEVVFSEDRAKIARQDGSISTTLDVLVSPEDDAEVRRVSVMNLGTANPGDRADLVCRGRAGAAGGRRGAPGVLESLRPDRVRSRAGRGARDAPTAISRRAAALAGARGGRRGRNRRRPPVGDRPRPVSRPRPRGPDAAALLEGQPLSNTRGLRAGSDREPPTPGAHPSRASPSGCRSRPWSRRRARRPSASPRSTATRSTFDRAATLAWTQAQVQLHHLGIGPDEAHLFQSLARRVLFLDRTLRPSADVLTRDTGGPAALWPHGISGDIPIVLVQIDEPDDVGIVRQLLRAHEYWRLKQLAVDLVILNERAPSYVQDLQSLLETLVRTSQSAAAHEGHAPARQRVHSADRTASRRRSGMPCSTAARAVLSNRRGTLAEQITREQRTDAPRPQSPRRSPAAKPPPDLSLPRPDLELLNGLGGFAAERPGVRDAPRGGTT